MSAPLFARLAIAGAAAATLGTVSVVPAGATTATPTPNPTRQQTQAANLATVKAKCDAQVQKRLTTLGDEGTTINAATDLSSGDKAQLLSTDTGDTSGLTTLDATIQADTTMVDALKDCRNIVVDYRVYLLFGPQVHMTIAADRLGSINAKLQALAAQLAQLLAQSKAPAADLTAAQAALTDLNAKVAAAEAADAGQSAAVLALTPQGYPGNVSALHAVRQALDTSRGDLKGARADVEIIRNALRQDHGTSSSSPGPSPSV